jgi:nucleotide-binding universal stress UspA family protein
MLRSILIGLDGSEDGVAALELGLRWAKAHNALAVGMAVVDTPGILNSGDVLFRETTRHHVAATLVAADRRRAGEIERSFVDRCREDRVKYRVLEETGTPYVQLLAEAQRHDLILLGRQTHFDHGSGPAPDETLRRVIRDSPRPVVAVPRAPTGDGPVVVAYDGSLQAARAVYAFEASGLGKGAPVHVASIDVDREGAATIASRAVDYLRSHEIEAYCLPLGTKQPPAELILKEVERLDAGLLVMGAYGQPVLREFFVGSVTRTMLDRIRVPVFCYH